MRVKLKGVNRVSKVLSNGQRVVYYYAWKGGPRLPGKPGDQGFQDAYHEATKARRTPAQDTLQAIINAYQDSPKFTDLAARTQADYVRNIRVIEKEYGTLPIIALPDPATRGDMLDWRDRMAKKSRRQADYVFATLAAILAWAKDRGRVTSNPCERPGKLYRANRAESVWSQDAEKALLEVAPDRIRQAYMLAVWTGQRQGDLIRLTWRAYDGHSIRMRQGKTGKRITIPVGAPLKAMLDAMPRRAVTILTTAEGNSWTSDGFRTTWRKSCVAAALIGPGIKGPTFHDIRGTAVTRLALAGCTVPEIATITGHALKDVELILDAHYLKRDSGLAESAMKKLVQHDHRNRFSQPSAQLPDDARD
ncbi:tyrosine-type recombinase/integrase [Paracoccus sulfuroxidans]|uniref:Phage integrase family protein n=1 Tax=Paracoccus sulfuroxidans TaxID=384678 RepID=A0A562N6Y6_9RHOB|nr:tyrosine-type recombinase/integrase [Paracoccus sulfuroxidans]AZV00309.1 integrase [Paracoccus phage vB_PsuS_Psul1]TWI27860.1 phage integrase family protein [Paracoccus sulfuroxidans]